MGRLRIFLGAAPGVGKTYGMLVAGHARRREGVDVVVGVVETHGRAETEALVEGLDVIPRVTITYKGQTLEEMDLDAILRRRPQLVLVDELAHTNAPGSRHPKRHLDVEEILAAGIDVYTTLNIQHVESLNNVVAQITRVRVRETVPDSMLERADDIEAVDISPDELIQRLREGKVYVPQTAERALRHFFSPGNLTALRELTLRRTVQRVDQQLLSHMRANAILGPWAAGERILVCVNEDPRGPALVRYTKRIADRLHAAWTAVYVETGRALTLAETQRDQIADTLRLASKLGGETLTLPSAGRDMVDDILAYAREHNVTHIVIGRTRRSRWYELLNGSIVAHLVQRAGDITVHVSGGQDDGEATVRAERQTRREPIRVSPYLASLLFVAVALGVAKAIEPFLGVQNVDLAFLTAIVAVAVRFGLYPSLFAVIISTLAYNFFFLPPIYTFTIADPRNVAALFFFTVVAVLVSGLAGRTKAEALIARQRAKTTEALYSFARKLATCVSIDEVLWASAYQMASMLKVRVVILLAEDQSLAVRAGYPPEDELDDADLAAANWAFMHDRSAGRGADTLPGARRLFVPMRTGRGAVGVVGFDADKEGPLFSPEELRLLDALRDQSALAIERVNLAEALDEARIAAETDKLRAALLTSISHDLKTPLASILGSASTIRDFRKDLDAAAEQELIGTIIEESERLNRFISNLLDMTRLESGAIAPNLSYNDLGDIVGSTLRRCKKILAGFTLDVQIPPKLPMLMIDSVLMEQTLFNIIDNAVKYSPAGSRIIVRARLETSGLVIEILDEGDGIPAAETEKIFEKSYRIRKGDGVRAGTGLGLAICRGFVEALGGKITASNRTDRSGAIFSIAFPASKFAPREDALA